MTLTGVKTIEDVRAVIAERKPGYVKVGVFDIDGVMRGKYMSRAKFLSALEKGFGFCDVVLGWDSQDQLYDNVTYTGWHTGYPDAPVRILPGSVRELPFEDDTLFFLGEFAAQAEAVCPRGILRRVLDRARGMGFTALAGFEYEFFVFEENAHSIREKHYRNLKPMAPGYFGYSVLRNSVRSEFYRELLDTCERMDFALEGLHEETGPGVLEGAITVDAALAAADKAALFKTFTKIVAQRCGLLATFMAKWSRDWPGQSGHIHISLKDADGKAVFHDPDKPHQMSDRMRHFVAGQQRLMPEFLAMIAPTINSFTRLIPGFWAPTEASWGIDNRTCALRVIPGGKSPSGSNFGSLPPMPIPTWFWPRPWPRGCGASKTRRPSPIRSWATPMISAFPQRSGSPVPCGRRPSVSRSRLWPGSGSAMPSWSTMRLHANGKNGNSASILRIGSWTATSKSFNMPIRKRYLAPDFHVGRRIRIFKRMK